MKKGVSLIEVLVAMAVFTVLMTSVTMVLTATLRAANKASAVTRVKSEGTFIMDTLATVLRYAENVTCPPDNTNGALVVNLASVSNDITYHCLTPNKITFDSGQLNSPKVNVIGCSLVPHGSCSRIDIQFSLQDADGVMTVPVNFSSQVELRNQ